MLTRDEVKRLLRHIRLRRYRIPIKLIYCCGLRLSECLALTVHDICKDEGKLWIRGGKGGKDRMVPIAQTMIEDLRRYWAFHRHPLLIFPTAGPGDSDPDKTAARMHAADRPIPISSLQRLMGSGENIIKYLGRYVCRTAIGDSRILSITDTHVSFRWKDRAHGDAPCTETIEGSEFVKRYLRHVLPCGLRAVRYYGFCHPAAKAKRERIAFHTGRPLLIGAAAIAAKKTAHTVACPCCGQPMRKLLQLLPAWRRARTPPATLRSCA